MQALKRLAQPVFEAARYGGDIAIRIAPVVLFIAWIPYLIYLDINAEAIAIHHSYGYQAYIAMKNAGAVASALLVVVFGYLILPSGWRALAALFAGAVLALSVSAFDGERISRAEVERDRPSAVQDPSSDGNSQHLSANASAGRGPGALGQAEANGSPSSSDTAGADARRFWQAAIGQMRARLTGETSNGLEPALFDGDSPGELAVAHKGVAHWIERPEVQEPEEWVIHTEDVEGDSGDDPTIPAQAGPGASQSIDGLTTRLPYSANERIYPEAVAEVVRRKRRMDFNVRCVNHMEEFTARMADLNEDMEPILDRWYRQFRKGYRRLMQTDVRERLREELPLEALQVPDKGG